LSSFFLSDCSPPFIKGLIGEAQCFPGEFIVTEEAELPVEEVGGQDDFEEIYRVAAYLNRHIYFSLDKLNRYATVYDTYWIE